MDHRAYIRPEFLRLSVGGGTPPVVPVASILFPLPALSMEERLL